MHRILLPVCLLLVIGCVPSKNPFFLADDAFTTEVVLGDWKSLDPENPMAAPSPTSFEKGEAKRLVIVTDGGNKRNQIQLFRLGHHCFADHFVNENGKEHHLVYKVSVVGNRMEWWTLDPKWASRLVANDPKAIAHEKNNSEEILLTAESKDLRAFLLKYVEDPNAFGKLARFERKEDLPIAKEGFADKKQRALDYWFELCMTCRSTFVDDKSATTTDIVKDFERITRDLEYLAATKGVDAESMECARQALAIYQALAKYAKDNDGPQKLIAAFDRAATTDRFGAAKELVEDKALKDQIGKTIEQFEKARAALEKRHDVKLMGIR